jgi:hypothetical protein
MLFKECIYHTPHTKHINKLCGQNTEFLHVSVHGAYSYHQALNGECFDGNIYVFSLTNFKTISQ